MRDLTPRQEEILNLIREWIETTGLPPTRAETAQRFGFNSPPLKVIEDMAVGVVRSGKRR